MPTLIPVENHSTTYKMTEDGEFVCAHEEAYIDKACCPAGTRDCGCQGRDSVICPALDCDGIQDHEIDELFDRLQPEEPDYED